VELGDATWPDIEATGRACVLAVPVGSLEQHGPHLPLDTDTQIAVELARRLSRSRSDVITAPPVAYGASGEHAAFAGTLLVNHLVLADLLMELIRSARASFAGVVLVSTHGGNHEGLSLVRDRCRADAEAAVVWTAAVAGGDAHAGRTETSLMLAIDPAAVRMELSEAGCTDPLEVLMPRLRAEGVRPISSNGVLGDPQGASAAEGELLLTAMTADLADAVGARWPDHGPTT
jgi:mycofactocin system creatininase family protein